MISLYGLMNISMLWIWFLMISIWVCQHYHNVGYLLLYNQTTACMGWEQYSSNHMRARIDRYNLLRALQYRLNIIILLQRVKHWLSYLLNDNFYICSWENKQYFEQITNHQFLFNKGAKLTASWYNGGLFVGIPLCSRKLAWQNQ